MADLLTRRRRTCVSRTAPGGHLGVLTGRSAMDTTWRHLDEFLRAYDERREAPAAAEAA